MLTVLVSIAVLLIPVLALAALLALVTAIHRARANAVARQIELTDAIHAELGAVVAPVVCKRVFGPWRVTMAVPFARPDVVEAVVSITDRVLGARRGAPAGLLIVLRPRPDRVHVRAA